MTDFDYVIVGGGSAGCVLAARLSEDRDARVLLLEAGSAEPLPAMAAAAAWPGLAGSAADWAGFTTAQADAGMLAYPRGRGLGGSGAVNAMAHLRGHRAVYDAWAARGAPGWGHDSLLPYFKRSEDAAGRDPALRGAGGPVRVAPVPETSRHPAARALAEALCAFGIPASGDLSGNQQEGVGWPDLAIDGVLRVSPDSAYLRPVLGRPNLAVLDRCLVTRLLVRGGQCAGAAYLRDDGAEQQAHAAEVIVCAGAIATPQLLMLSGIGPADYLRGFGIDRSPTCRGWERTFRTTRSPWRALPRRCRCRAASTTTGRSTRRCAARWPARGPTCSCFPSCCRSRRPPTRSPPAASR
jgi:choline dehydrogenase